MAKSDLTQSAFRALADPTRRAILAKLAQGPLSIAEIAADFEMTRPAIAKHLGILREGGVIVVEKQGRERINRLQPAGLKAAADWLSYFDQFWDERLSALKKAAEREEKK